MLASKAKQAHDDDDDLIGDTSPKKKSAKKVKAKPAKKAKGNSDRAARGKGEYYFPKDEREKFAKVVAKSVKAKISVKDLAEKMEEDAWRVRLAAKTAARAKLIRLSKSGPKGGHVMLSPR